MPRATPAARSLPRVAPLLPPQTFQRGSAHGRSRSTQTRSGSAPPRAAGSQRRVPESGTGGAPVPPADGHGAAEG